MSGEEQEDGQGRQAVKVLRALSHFEYPRQVGEVEEWLRTTRPLQALVRRLCERDASGRVMQDCVNVLYDLVATNGEEVSPAVWGILEVVNESEVPFLVENFLKDCLPRLRNALCALVCGVSLCGHRIPQIQTWCYALLKGLEEKQKHSIVLTVPKSVMLKLFHGLLLSHTRQLVYPVLERILYPSMYPHLFNMIVDQIPEVLSALSCEEDEETKNVCERFRGLVKMLLGRFPILVNDEKLEKLKEALDGLSDVKYKPLSNLCLRNPKPNYTTKISSLLECPVCYERFVTPVTVCENGHCICSNCKEQLNNCPLCRAHFSNIRMTIVDQIMEITEFKCKNFDSGCNVKMLYKDIWEHEINCEFRTVACDIVTGPKAPHIVCKEDVVVAYFHKHIEKCHKMFVTSFELNCERRGELRRQRVNEIRLLKNAASNLYFIERVFVTDEEIFFSYHYVGNNVDAKNYVYTIQINGYGIPQKITYSNFCLPNYMTVFETEENDRCLTLDPEKIFRSCQTKLEYSVKIEDVNTYRFSLKRNKFVVSI